MIVAYLASQPLVGIGISTEMLLLQRIVLQWSQPFWAPQISEILFFKTLFLVALVQGIVSELAAMHMEAVWFRTSAVAMPVKAASCSKIRHLSYTLQHWIPFPPLSEDR